MPLNMVTASPVILTIQAGQNTQRFTMTDVDVSLYALELVSGSLIQGTPGSLTFRLTRAAIPQANIFGGDGSL